MRLNEKRNKNSLTEKNNYRKRMSLSLQIKSCEAFSSSAYGKYDHIFKCWTKKIFMRYSS